MKKALVTPLVALCLLGGLIAFSGTEASAVVCAKGVVRAGCAGPRGAAVVHRGVVAPRRGVVIRR
ncbi:hypothetical protein SAMN05444161_2257 [Rhizobiales bacterium GAS191]|nr:hypothetical protein SAMN05519103_01371 [Rhizobiales bacterium GAS113]SEC98515.1 hypothetical protein SAMN05444161_2257 [Rhizobiales bacterium GAS191]